MLINAHLSDIFFNRAFDEECKQYDRGQFVGYNHEAMITEAETLLFSLDGLGVGGLPSPEELVEDFYARV